MKVLNISHENNVFVEFWKNFKWLPFYNRRFPEQNYL